jgi:hypothetical protein
MMAREAEKESVLYERQRDTSPAQLPGGGNCAGWVEKDGAGSAVGESEQFATSMQLGAQSWDFGVNLTNNLAPPHTPGGRISNWLQNARDTRLDTARSGNTSPHTSARRTPAVMRRRNWEWAHHNGETCPKLTAKRPRDGFSKISGPDFEVPSRRG